METTRTIEGVLECALADDVIDQETRDALRAELDELREKAAMYDGLCK